MSAEQHHHLFSIDYQQELRAPFFSNAMDSFLFWKEKLSIRELDAHGVYQDILKLSKKHGFEEALFSGLLRFSLDLWALQQEMEGRRHTQELATFVTIEDGKAVFQNNRYPDGTNLLKMYEASLTKITDDKVARYARENDQVFALYTHLEPWIQKITSLFEHDDSTEALLALGFTWHEIPLTPSLLATVPSLCRSFSSMDDLYTLISSGKKVRVLMAPEHLLTLSPQHWLHKKAKSTFWWNTRLIVFPDTKETAIIQNSIFSHTPLMGSVDFLSYQQKEEKRFHSEQELMQFINVVTTHTDVHPSILLDMIVDTVDIFEDAEKIDPNIKEGTLDVRPYIKAVEDIFRFEFERCEREPEYEKGIDDRLLMLTNLITHKIARLNAIGIQSIAHDYTMKFDTLKHANAPLEQEESFFQSALTFDPDLNIQIDLSGVDCTIGTLFNGIRSAADLNLGEFFATVDVRFGVGAGEFLQKSSREGITSQSELLTFCDRFKLDHTRFHPGKCITNGCPSTFVGECSICPACEMLDNFGITRDWGSVPETPLDSTTSIRSSMHDDPSCRVIGPGDWISVATTGDWQQFQLAP